MARGSSHAPGVEDGAYLQNNPETSCEVQLWIITERNHFIPETEHRRTHAPSREAVFLFLQCVLSSILAF